MTVLGYMYTVKGKSYVMTLSMSEQRTGNEWEV